MILIRNQAGQVTTAFNRHDDPGVLTALMGFYGSTSTYLATTCEQEHLACVAALRTKTAELETIAAREREALALNPMADVSAIRAEREAVAALPEPTFTLDAGGVTAIDHRGQPGAVFSFVFVGGQPYPAPEQ